jgi:hypothetical protein
MAENTGHVDLHIVVSGSVLKISGTVDTFALWCHIELKEHDQRGGNIHATVSSFRTSAKVNTKKPQWNHRGEIEGMKPHHVLHFNLNDHPMAPPLGSARLTYNEVFPDGFKGELILKNGAASMGFLDVRVFVSDPEGEAASMIQRNWRVRQKIRNEGADGNFSAEDDLYLAIRTLLADRHKNFDDENAACEVVDKKKADVNTVKGRLIQKLQG